MRAVSIPSLSRENARQAVIAACKPFWAGVPIPQAKRGAAMSTFRIPAWYVAMALVLALSVCGASQGRAQAPGTAKKTALQLQMQAASAAQAAALAVCDYDVWLQWHNLYGYLHMM
jgi:hypothetical protein